MAYFIQLVFAGIALGCIYALIGLGFSIIYKASGVINFAQGELLLVGAYIVSAGVFEWHLGFLSALLLGIINFAQGDLVLGGVYIASAGVFEQHLAFLAALLLGLVATVVIGLLFER